MAKKKAKVLTLGSAGIPKCEIHDLTAIPLAQAADRLRFVDWEDVHRVLMRDKAVSIEVSPEEADAALVHLLSYAKDVADYTGVVESTYCRVTGRLWLFRPPVADLPGAADVIRGGRLTACPQD